MYCKNCGLTAPEGAVFCANCGAAIPAQETPEATVITDSPRNSELATAAGRKAMIWGIIALVLSEWGIVGLIISIIAKKHVKGYIAEFGPCTGKAKVGQILSTVALIVSIVMTCVWAIYIAYFVFLIIFAASVGM